MGIAFRLLGVHLEPLPGTLAFGTAVMGAAYVLSVACEVSQLDIPRSLSIALIAILAVLPEYAVDFYFAWTAAHEPAHAAYAAANMTGANRLLIGFGWALVAVLYWFKARRSVDLHVGYMMEIKYLLLATLYSFFIPIKGRIDLLDAAVLVGLFVLYMREAYRAPVEEPELVGVPARIGAWPKGPRRFFVAFSFLFAGVAILASTEPFAESLVALGKSWGIDEFLLVQWLAPLASESPEIIVATVFALRGNPVEGLGALISSKVNQWTLLVGTLPVVYSVSGGAPMALRLDARQIEEVALTAAQSLFAAVLLGNLSLSLWEAAALFTLFAAQLVLPAQWVRWGFTGAYLALAVAVFLASSRHRHGLLSLVKR